MTVESQPSPPILRPMTECSLAVAAWIHAAAFGDAGDDAVARAERLLREELARPWASIELAFLGDEAAGLSIAWVVADEVQVIDVATHPVHRRRGVGRALVKGIVDLARRRNAARVHLELRRSNAAALALYRGAGFGVVRRRVGYYADGEDGLEMTLGLDASGAVLPPLDDVAL